ncbi:MAG: transposase [Bacteroidetes bacterium]|nr:transposase [Bacteroidota bacterium]
MPIRKTEFLKGEYYHIYNRGANKQNIFLCDDNYRYCVDLFSDYSQDYRVSIIAFCLMPNHYHLLIRQDDEKTISEFIRTLFNAYVQAFNKWHKRTGTLFESRFKHIQVETDDYVLQLCRYIHLNPVEAGLVSVPEKWEFSNYREWIGIRSKWVLDSNFIRQYFSHPDEYKNYVMQYWEEKQRISNISDYILE